MSDLDVICFGRAFVDVILTGLPRMPRLDEEIYGQNYDLDTGGGVAITPARLFLETVGINHANWGLRLWLDGDEVLADLHQQVRDLPPERVMDAKKRYPWVLRLFKIYGLIPSPYLRYYYFHQEMVEEARAASMTRAEEIIAELPGIFSYYEAQSRSPHPKLEKRRGSTAHGDLAVDVMVAIAHDTGQRLVVNVPNQGTVDNFDDVSIVEVPAVVDAAGAHPWPQGALPRDVAGLIEDLKLHEELVVEAALTGSRDLALKALLASPLMRCASKAEALLDEMMAAHRDYLPQFG